MKLLHVDSSALGQHSVTRVLTAATVRAFQREHAKVQVKHRDLAAETVPHWTPVVDASRDPDALGEQLLDEFLAADAVVIGAPMYNFSIPSQLKAWIDRLAVAGRTFRYTEKGPQGLAGGKKLIVALSRGGFYQGDGAVMDFQEPYLRAVFGFMGITDISVVRAEGVAMGPEQKATAMADALAAIESLITTTTAKAARAA